jgi:hypothetical protein
MPFSLIPSMMAGAHMRILSRCTIPFYSAMARSNVAIELPEKIKVTIDGRVTDNKDESYGRETTFLLTHP